MISIFFLRLEYALSKKAMAAILTFGNRTFEQLMSCNVKNGNISRSNDLYDKKMQYLNDLKEDLSRQSKRRLIEKIVTYENERQHFQESVKEYEWKLKLYDDIVMEREKLENDKRQKKEHLFTTKWDILRDNFDKAFKEESA